MIQIEQNIFNIFPIFVFHEENFLSVDQCDRILNFLKEEKTTQHDLIHGSGTSSHHERPILENSILYKISKFEPNVVNHIHERIEYLTYVSKTFPCQINFSWFNIQNENSYLLPHAHTNSVVSGALYINTDEESSSLDFINPNYASFVSYSVNDQSYIYKHKVKRGSLIIFPSYLAHGNFNTINKTNNRVVISFNTSATIGLKYDY